MAATCALERASEKLDSLTCPVELIPCLKLDGGLVEEATALVRSGGAVAFIALAIGLWLRKWQTLHAAMVALTAAMLAYKSAMAKVEYDRSLSDLLDRQQTYGIATRLQYATFIFGREAQLTIALLENWKHVEKVEGALVGHSFKELAEAWTSLDRLPRGVIFHIDRIRNYLDNVEAPRVNVVGPMPLPRPTA